MSDDLLGTYDDFYTRLRDLRAMNPKAFETSLLRLRLEEMETKEKGPEPKPRACYDCAALKKKYGPNDSCLACMD